MYPDEVSPEGWMGGGREKEGVKRREGPSGPSSGLSVDNEAFCLLGIHSFVHSNPSKLRLEDAARCRSKPAYPLPDEVLSPRPWIMTLPLQSIPRAATSLSRWLLFFNWNLEMLKKGDRDDRNVEIQTPRRVLEKIYRENRERFHFWPCNDIYIYSWARQLKN